MAITAAGLHLASPCGDPDRVARLGAQAGGVRVLTGLQQAGNDDEFAQISGDSNPIHLDDEVARSCGYDGRVSHGFVSESLAAAAAVETFSSETGIVVILEKATQFRRPAYVGDVITAVVEVESRSESSRLLRVSATTTNQHGQTVVTSRMLLRLLARGRAS